MRALIACAALLAAGCGPVPSAPATSAEAAAPAAASPGLLPKEQRVAAPEVEFVGAQGGVMTLERFEGRVVLLNLWATWCAPCVREMPSLDRLAADQPALAVVPVSMDLQAPSAARFLERHGLAHLPLYHDPSGQLMRRLGAHGLPASFVIDRKGRVAAVVRGSVDWTSAPMRELLAGV